MKSNAFTSIALVFAVVAATAIPVTSQIATQLPKSSSSVEDSVNPNACPVWMKVLGLC